MHVLPFSGFFLRTIINMKYFITTLNLTRWQISNIKLHLFHINVHKKWKTWKLHWFILAAEVQICKTHLYSNSQQCLLKWHAWSYEQAVKHNKHTGTRNNKNFYIVKCLANFNVANWPNHKIKVLARKTR